MPKYNPAVVTEEMWEDVTDSLDEIKEKVIKIEAHLEFQNGKIKEACSKSARNEEFISKTKGAVTIAAFAATCSLAIILFKTFIVGI